MVEYDSGEEAAAAGRERRSREDEKVTPNKFLVVGQNGSITIQSEDDRKFISWTELTLAWNIFQFLRNKTGTPDGGGNSKI